MLPLYGTLANAMGAHPSYINQLTPVITTSAGSASNVAAICTTAAASMQSSSREKTPEPPPAPKFSLYSSLDKVTYGQAPMELEELESEPETTATVPTTQVPTLPQPKTVPDKIQFNMHDPSLLFNGIMPAALNPAASPGYMFFPATAAATAATTPTAATAAGSMLMDPSAMMAAAMQQIQQTFAGYGTINPDAVGAEGTQMTAAGAEPYTVKQIIKTKSCTLFPPNPNALPPTIRERPPGCRTVFVGGLPENITEEIINEIFETCGEITTLRMSKKNFCHIRFRLESCIDRAIYFSGYRVRISNSNEPANYGRLHVDYAQARDDQYEYECKLRQLQREQRHRERLPHDRLRSQSPPALPHYTDHEASSVAENLRNNDTFLKAIQTIAAWLERGDCNKRNANTFYSMIQSTHAHVRRLNTDKQQLEDDLRKSRESYRKQMLVMSTQFTQIEKVFNAASHKKVWDHFTKAQRKNIDQWKRLALELRSVQIEDDEMEMSDDDQPSCSRPPKRSRYDTDNLKEENDSLRCQLEAIRNEMSLERTDSKYSNDFLEKQMKVLQETIRNMQTQLMQLKLKEQKDARTIEQLECKLKEAGVKQLLLNTKIKKTAAKLKENNSQFIMETNQSSNNHSESDVQQTESSVDEDRLSPRSESKQSKDELNQTKSKDKSNDCLEEEYKQLNNIEAKLIALTSTYLMIHPNGSDAASICAYLNNMNFSETILESNYLEDKLDRYTNIFKLAESAKDNVKLWYFCGFDK